MKELHKLIPTTASSGSGTRTRSSHIAASEVKMRRAMKKMRQIEKDGEDDEEGGKDELRTSPTIPVI